MKTRLDKLSVKILKSLLSVFSFLLVQLSFAQLQSGQRIDIYVQDGTIVTVGASNIQWSKMTHAVYAFLNPMDATGSLYLDASGDPGSPVSGSVWYNSSRFNSFLTTAKAANSNIKIIISMGGAPTASDPNITSRLNSIFASSTARNTLATDIATFIQKHNIDGFDLDHEHPKYTKDGGAAGDVEITNHKTFVALVKSKLDALESSMCKDMEVSLALNGDCNKLVVSPGGQDYVDPTIISSVDAVHLMTYDASAANGFTNHAPLQMAEDAVTAFSSPPFSWPKNKMLIGIPFYGRPSPGSSSSATYVAINSTNSSTPSNTDTYGGYGYNGCPTITSKVNYAMGNGLLGVVVWEGTQDILTGSNSLLGCIFSATGLSSVPATEGTCCSKPVLGNDILTCHTAFNITLNSGTSTASNVTFTWKRISPTSSTLTSGSSTANTQTITSADGAGTYVVIRDSTAGGITCSRSDTVVINSSFSSPDLTPTPRTLCSSNSYTLIPNNASSFPSGTVYQWQKNSTDLSGETTNSLYVNAPGTYTLKTSLTGCTATSSSVVINGSGAQPVDACRTTSGTLTLSVTGGTGPFTWYDSDIPGGNIVGTGSSFTTPTLSSSTIYYVEDAGAATTYNLGITTSSPTGFADPVTNPADYTNSTIAMEFNVTSPVKIKGVDVFPWGGATYPFSFKIEIYNMDDQIVYTSSTTTYSAWPGSSAQTIALDANLSTGYYRIRAVLASGSNVPAFFHQASSTFPYTGASISITKEIGTGQYGPFFKWQIADFGGCARIPVRAVIGSCTGTLPVAFSYFNVSKEEQGSVFIEWASSREKNNDHYIVERSSDGNIFAPISQIEGNINSSSLKEYNYIDYSAPTGKNYYRIAQYDKDGTITRTEIRTIEIDASLSITISPNPFNNAASIYLNENTSVTELRIFDINGKLIQSSAYNKSEHKITFGESLKPGFYVVQIITGNFVNSYKLIKE